MFLVNQLYVNARFLTQKITGVQRFAIELSKQLKKQSIDVIFLTSHDVENQEVFDELNALKIGKFSGHFWEQFELPLYLKKHNSPLLLNLANTAPLFYKNKISVIHDIAFERYPQSFSLKFRCVYHFLIPRIISSSKRVATVSEFSKIELVNYYSINPDKISIVYNATSSFFRKSVNDKLKDERYVLAVSSLNYQKNFHSLIKAFNKIEDSNLKLYLIGDINRNFADQDLINDIESNENVVFLGRVSDDELIQYYSSALVFVYPSLYEGFGIPPLEAQACGAPCLVSDVASLPEVCLDSALYCDPFSVEDITEKLNLVIFDKELRNELIEKGFKNIKRFSWENSSSDLLKIVKAVI